MKPGFHCLLSNDDRDESIRVLIVNAFEELTKQYNTSYRKQTLNIHVSKTWPFSVIEPFSIPNSSLLLLTPASLTELFWHSVPSG